MLATILVTGEKVFVHLYTNKIKGGWRDGNAPTPRTDRPGALSLIHMQRLGCGLRAAGVGGTRKATGPATKESVIFLSHG